MTQKDFYNFMCAYLMCDDPDFLVEMRWHHNYDGSTKWHLLINESSMARYGLFPFQADYRMVKTTEK